VEYQYDDNGSLIQKAVAGGDTYDYIYNLQNRIKQLKVNDAVAEKMRKHEKTGRPLGSENFVVKLEKILDRMLRPGKAGRKPKKRTLRNVMEKRK
jgi:hypothetical protein